MRRIVLGLFLLIGSVVLAQTPPPAHIERISVSSSGEQGDGVSGSTSVSPDGRYIAFTSRANNLVAGDISILDNDVFLHDRQLHETTKLTDSDIWKASPSVSADGRYIAFEMQWDLAQVRVHDRQANLTRTVSVNSYGDIGNLDSVDPAISRDGRYVVFTSYATNLVADDTNARRDVFVHDRQISETTRISVDSNGVEGNDDSGYPDISEDGRYVAFTSYATNLVADDTNARGDVFIHDRQTHETTRVSVNSGGIEANSYSFECSISGDGRFVVFTSGADNLTTGDSHGFWDVFVHDRQTHETARVSVSSGGIEGNSDSWAGDTISAGAGISADGRFVAFISMASNLVPGDTNYEPITFGGADVFVHDRQTRETTRVSVNSSGIEGNSYSSSATISADGHFVVFGSRATNLVEGDSNGWQDVFVAENPFSPPPTPPTAPTNLTAMAIDSSHINLAWTASTDNVGVTGYKIYRDDVLLTTLGNVTSYADSGLTGGKTYTYYVTALDAAGSESSPSNKASATAPVPPSLASNLIPNPGFESDASGWVLPAIGSIDKITPPHSGTKSAKLAATSNLYAYFISSASSINVTAGKSYAVSLWIKRSSVLGITLGKGITAYVNWYTSLGGTLSPPKVIVTGLVGTGDWTQYQATVIAPSGAAKAKIYFGFDRASGTAWFDDISMVQQ